MTQFLVNELLIHMHNVTKTYPNGITALNDISLGIKQGEFVFLMGQSGAGKSSLIKLLNIQEKATRGTVFVFSRNIKRMKNREIPHYRRKLGFVFQDFKLLENKTVWENIAFALQIMGKGKKEIIPKVAEAIKEVGLLGKEDCFPHQLSGGEQQRVSIARAIVNQPLILIADEPTGNLDQETATDILNLLLEINRKGTTVIMATHARDLVRKTNKRILILEKGRIAADSTASFLE